MHRSLKNVFAATSVSQARRRFQPAMESLEDRWCPSCTVTTADGGHTLIITGDNGANMVVIEQNDTSNKLTVVCDGGAPQVFSSTSITKIKVDLQGGADQLWYGLASASNFKYAKSADLKTGAGDDTVTIDMWQGINQPCNISSNLSIQVDAGADHDEVDADFGRKRGGVLLFQANANTGDDLVQARMWGDITTKAKVTFDLQGGIGDDTVGTWNTYDNHVPGYGSIDVHKDSQFTIYLKGGAGADKLFLTCAGELDGKLNILLDGGAGDDLVSATQNNNNGIYLMPGSTGSLKATFMGGSENDEIEFEVWDKSGGAALVNALSDGGDGYDHSTHTTNVAGINSEWYTSVY
jgi:hypothetical protein